MHEIILFNEKNYKKFKNNGQRIQKSNFTIDNKFNNLYYTFDNYMSVIYDKQSFKYDINNFNVFSFYYT